MRDVLAAEGAVMLGSRLKRLAERLQSGAELIGQDCGLPTQPAHMPLLTTLWRKGAMNVGEVAAATGFSQPAITRAARQVADMGLVGDQAGEGDRRVRRLALTPEGRAVMERAETALWPRLRAAVAETCDVEALLVQVAALEAALAERPLELRPGPGFAVRPFRDELAGAFARINRQWIETMYSIEAVDEAQLADPRGTIVEPGGDILFLEDPELGIVGTCGLLRTGPDEYELIKMAVVPEARGRGAGEFLLRATVERALAMGAELLFLLTNSKSQSAIRLYERNGFAHDAGILASYGAEYDRCDVAMRYLGAG